MYKIEFLKIALKSLKKIDNKYQSLILKKIKELAENPFENTNVKALKGSKNSFRLRVADYRVIYKIENDELIIIIVDIDHRSKIYKK